MDYLFICVIAILVSAVTLFSGFGLGTALMPAFALFFPVPVAIAATAVVHLANNLFKVALVGGQADPRVVVRFGLSAAVAAIVGASLLDLFAGLPVLAIYDLGGRTHEITAIKVVIGSVIIVFALLELSPRFASLEFPPRYLALGGVLSGFFGGLSGNQGAFRAAFLVRAGLDKATFIGTSVVSAVIVDIVRLTVYGVSFYRESFTSLPSSIVGVVVAAMAAAFFGAFLGARLIHKVTMRAVQLIVAITMIAVGSGLMIGLV
ncbi:MAG: TSUP family transporter [Alphaproteobacteria bacterium]|nr:TSUP family transporter [Alphaproteobacteria bacterium]